MPKASKETASDSMQMEGYEGHYENFDGGDGGYTVAFETTPRTPIPASSSRDCRTIGASASTGAT